MIKAFIILLLFVLSGCATQGHLKEDKPAPTEAVQKEEVSVETLANFCTGFYAMMGRDWKTATTFFKKALEGDPESERILRYLIACHIQLDENDKALVYMKKLSDINRKDFTIHYTLASIHEEKGRTDDAILEYERACRSDIKQVDKALVANALYRLAHLYLNKSEPMKAVTCFKDIIKLASPVDVSSLHTEIGMAYIDAQEYEKARQELETSKELNPNLPATRLYLAIVHDELGELDEAIAEAETFLQTTPNTWLAHAFLASLYAKVDKTEDADFHRSKAIAILQTRVATGASNAQEHITLARLLIAENKKNEALRIMELANNMPRTKEEAREVHFMLANLYYDANRAAQVEQQLREALRIDPNFHEASNFLGYLFAERGVELDEALQLIEGALKVQPENGAYLDSLGWVYYKQATDDESDERMSLALEKLLKAVKMSPDPEIYKHIGEIYYSQGRWEKARQQWQRALEEFPEYEVISHIEWIKKKLERLETLQIQEDKLYQEKSTAP
ncbi:MAG: tetratricopeptide repeat protein [Candidatus Brocadiales bacterium]